MKLKSRRKISCLNWSHRLEKQWMRLSKLQALHS